VPKNANPSSSRRWPVLIAGGGPVGLTLAALLARQGVRSRVIEADDSYCTGSRAICLSRRSQEILAWAGAEAALARTGLPWSGGRTFWRDAQVLHFELAGEPTQRFAPMINIQQYHVEQFVHEALQAAPELALVSWGARVTAVRPGDGGVEVDVAGPGGAEMLHAQFLVACDGAGSTVREQLGLQLEGTRYEGRCVVVDIVQKSDRPVERLVWFDPPSNPGGTVVMDRQPGGVWRIEYQLGPDEDPRTAAQPEQVLPRVRSHLAMLGEHEPWEPLWTSVYGARCLTLRDYRCGRVFFAGDAAHLLPIFGVHGLNCGLEDAGNLAWKLARVVAGDAPDALLDSYSAERVPAVREYLAHGARRTEFMTPPGLASRLMREAALRLAATEPSLRTLIHPMPTAPAAYPASPLNLPQQGDWTSDMAAPGQIAPEALLAAPHGDWHLTQCFGKESVCLVFGDGPLPQAIADLTQHGIAVLDIPPEADRLGQARERYGLARARAQGLVLVRPDGHVMGRWRGLDPSALLAALNGKGLA